MSEIQQSHALAAEASSFGVGRLKPGSLVVTVGSKISTKNLHDLIDAIAKRHGCMACGLGGLDVIIRQQDILVAEVFQQIPEVKDVAILR